ncbi:MAG: nitrilase-related carbon-nitrogen hydrolase [Armatimonadota bacterium]|nr:nitrilase-related carbon-nitrogen hydrolase [Armatimonadota bacterium]
MAPAGKLGRWQISGLATGFFLFLAYPPLDLGPIAWIALVPLLQGLRRASLKEGIWMGFASGFTFYLLVGCWFLTLVRYQHLVPLVYGLLAVYWAIPWAAFAVVALLVRRQALAPLLIAAAWVGSEYLRGLVSLGLSWPLLGSSQHNFLPALQVATLVGQYGPSFLVALGNAAIDAALSRRWIVAWCSGALAVGAFLWGATTMPAIVGELPVAAVFTDFSPQEKWNPASLGWMLSGLVSATEEAARRGAKLVVWPETALPVDLLGPLGIASELSTLARRLGIGLFGTALQEGKYNMVVSFDRDGTLRGRYDKTLPVPFVETHLVPGNRLSPLPSSLGPVGIAICWESMFPGVLYAHVRKGAILLAIVTNDAYVGRSGGARHHAVSSLLRAIETRRYVVHAANGSPSWIIDPYGRVIAAAGEGRTRYALARVSPRTEVTMAVRLGDTFPQICLAVALSAWFFLLPKVPLTGPGAGHTMISTSLQCL